MSWRPLLLLLWISISSFLSLYSLSNTCCRWLIACLILKSPEEEQGRRTNFNRFSRCHSLTQSEQHTMFPCTHKWGLAAAWPRSFSLMSWRNRQSLWGQNTQKDSSITPPALFAHLPVENPVWLRGGEGHNLCYKSCRSQMIPYRLAGILNT